jgi:transposase-like protein
VPAAKYTPEQRAEALALYETHGPSAVTEQLGIPKGTVTGWAKEAGVRTVRTSRTREATEARAVDVALLRTEAEAAEMEILRWEQEKVLAVRNGTAKWQTVLKGSGGSEHAEELDFIPPQDARAVHSARQSINVTASKLAEANASRTDASSGAVSVIDKLMAGFASAYEAGK